MRISVSISLLALLTLFCVFGCIQPQGAGNATGNTTISTSPNISGNQPAANSSSIPLASGNITQINTTIETNITQTSNTSANNLPGNSLSANTSQNNENFSGTFFGGGYVLVLDDISITGSTTCGIFSIRYAFNNSIVPNSNFIGCPVQSHYWRSPEGNTYRVRVEKVAAGYSQESDWAQVSIFG